MHNVNLRGQIRTVSVKHEINCIQTGTARYINDDDDGDYYHY